MSWQEDYDPEAETYHIMGPPEPDWQDELESQAARIEPSPLERELAGCAQSSIMGPPEQEWTEEDDADVSRLIAVCQERDAALQDAVTWLEACKNWCQQCQDQERSIRWLAWTVYVLSAWVILDVLCHVVRRIS